MKVKNFLGRGSSFVVMDSPRSALGDFKKAVYLFQEEGDQEMVDMINILIGMIELTYSINS